MLDVNTTSKYPTHFLRAVEIIKKARDDFRVPSENWPNPTEYRFGFPTDHYYAEVWVDGMDWQPSYWVIEELDLRKPQIRPLIIFNMHEDRSKFNNYDFSELIHAMLYYRRDVIWSNKGELSYFTDTVWPYLSKIDNTIRNKEMKKYYFEHNSQEKVEFWLNEIFVPERYRENESNWDSGDSSKELGGSPSES